MIHIHFLPLYDVWNFSASDMSCLDWISIRPPPGSHHTLVWVSWELLHKKGSQESEIIKNKKLLINFILVLEESFAKTFGWFNSINMQNIHKFYLNFQPETLHSQVSFHT